MMQRVWRVAFVTLALLFCCRGTARAAEPGDELTISVLTIGPGDHPFFKFGHNGILVEDRSRRRKDVYNFGTFDFRSKTLFSDFMKGRLLYWLSVQSLEGTISHYAAERRSIEAQELDLSPAERREVADALRTNALPQNRAYRYDYFRDNCSTRVRDAIDTILRGRVHESSRGPGSMTLRAHAIRLTADDLLVSLGLDVAMGNVVDRPITEWDEMFVPSKFQESLRRVTNASTGAPVVKSERFLLTANRPPLRSSPPNRIFSMLAVGVGIGTILFALGRAATRRKSDRIVLGIVLAVGGMLVGTLGTIFLTFWTTTDHEVAFHNENLLQLVPWALALLVAGPGLAMGRPWAMKLAERLTLAAAAASTIGLLLKVLPWFNQHNGAFIALLLPLWIGAAAGTRELAKSHGAKAHR